MRTWDGGRKLPESALRYVLEGLVPYTDANLKLAFHPGRFFYDLERISQRKQRTLQNAFYRARRESLLKVDESGVPRLTEFGKAKVVQYKPKVLGEDARLLIVFDVPESDRWKRRQLRTLLKQLSFRQVQKSVWESKFDHREYLEFEINRLGLRDEVVIYEALPLHLA